LSRPEKVLLVIVEIRRHQSRIIFTGRRLEGPQVGPIGFASLIESNLPQRWRGPLNNIEEVFDDGHVDFASFCGSWLFDVSPKDDMGKVDLAKFALQIAWIEQVSDYFSHSFRQRRRTPGQPVYLCTRNRSPMFSGGVAAHTVNTGDKNNAL
jgi:hypothetical protein